MVDRINSAVEMGRDHAASRDEGAECRDIRARAVGEGLKLGRELP
jgi:hypothetical protein